MVTWTNIRPIDAARERAEIEVFLESERHRAPSPTYDDLLVLARAYLKEGLPPWSIAKLTGLPLAQIDRLAAERPP